MQSEPREHEPRQDAAIRSLTMLVLGDDAVKQESKAGRILMPACRPRPPYRRRRRDCTGVLSSRRWRCGLREAAVAGEDRRGAAKNRAGQGGADGEAAPELADASVKYGEKILGNTRPAG